MWILRYQGHGDFHSILVMSSLLPLPGSVCGRRHEITPGRKPASNHRAYGHERHIVTFPRRFPSACGTSRSRSYDPGQVIFDWFGRLRTGLTNTQQRHAALGRGQYQSIPVGVGQLYQCLSLGLRLCSLPRLEADSTSQGFPGWQLPHSDLVSGHVRAPRLCCDLSLVFAAGRHMMSSVHADGLCSVRTFQVMIANISPSHLSYEDTLNTLKYANRAKNIRVSASQQLIQPDDHVRNLDAEQMGA